MVCARFSSVLRGKAYTPNYMYLIVYMCCYYKGLPGSELKKMTDQRAYECEVEVLSCLKQVVNFHTTPGLALKEQ